MWTQVNPEWLKAAITQALPWITVRDAGSLHMFCYGRLEPRRCGYLSCIDFLPAPPKSFLFHRLGEHRPAPKLLNIKPGTCQCRRRGFDPWSGKIPPAAEQLGPRAATADAPVPTARAATRTPRHKQRKPAAAAAQRIQTRRSMRLLRKPVSWEPLAVIVVSGLFTLALLAFTQPYDCPSTLQMRKPSRETTVRIPQGAAARDCPPEPRDRLCF